MGPYTRSKKRGKVGKEIELIDSHRYVLQGKSKATDFRSLLKMKDFRINGLVRHRVSGSLLSGSVRVGKSTIVKMLTGKYNFNTKDYEMVSLTTDSLNFYVG